MKCLLLLTMMLVSATCIAQREIRRGISGYEREESTTHIEIGLSAGVALLDIVERGSQDDNNVHNGLAVLTAIDFYHGKSAVVFQHGGRLGNDPFNAGYISYVLGLQYSTASGKDRCLRFSATTGPMLSNFKSDLVGELSAGLLINRRVSAGLKYMHAFWPIETGSYRDPSYIRSAYNMKYILVEVTYRFGSGDR